MPVLARPLSPGAVAWQSAVAGREALRQSLLSRSPAPCQWLLRCSVSGRMCFQDPSLFQAKANKPFTDTPFSTPESNTGSHFQLYFTALGFCYRLTRQSPYANRPRPGGAPGPSVNLPATGSAVRGRIMLQEEPPLRPPQHRARHSGGPALPDQLVCLSQEWVERLASPLPLGSHRRHRKGSHTLQTTHRP